MNRLLPCAVIAILAACSPSPTQLVITTAPLTFDRGACSQAVTVQAQDASNKPVKLGSELRVQLSGDPTVFTFASDAACANAVQGVTLAKGSDQASFFLKGVKAGSGTLNAVATALTSATQKVTVVEPPYPVSQICVDLAAALCDYEVRCGLMSGEASCLGLVNDKYHTLFGCGQDQTAALNDGRLTEDPATARACLAAIKSTVSCTRDDLLGTTPECVNAFTGTVMTGATCYVDDECGTSGYCTSTGTSCPGQCQARLQVGQTASRDRSCAQGLYVYAGKCATPVAAAGSCAPNGDVAKQKCAAGSYCDKNDTCSALLSATQACQADTDCEQLLICSNGTCGSPGAINATCNLGLFGQPNIPCQLDLYCDVTSIGTPGTCKPLEQENGPCFLSFQCASGLFCSGANLIGTPTKGTCRPQHAAGDTCGSTDDCVFPLYCDGSGHCANRKALDTACTPSLAGECSSAISSKECASGLCCTNGQCKPVSCHDPTP